MPFPSNPLDKLLLESGDRVLQEDGASRLILDESVQLDVPANGGTTTSTTPTLAFQGSNLSGGQVGYELQVGTNSPLPGVTLDNKFASAQSGASGSITQSYTVNSGNNRLLVVAHITGSPTSMTYSGVALTQAFASTSGSHSIWYLAAPAVGTANLVITYPGAVGNRQYGIHSFNNVDQTTPFGTFVAYSAGALQPTSYSIDVPVTRVNAAIYDLFDANDGGIANTITPTTGQTSQSMSGSGDNASNGYKLNVALGTVTVGYTESVANASYLTAVAINPSTTGYSSVRDLGFRDETASIGDDRLLLEDGTSLLLQEDNTSKLTINYSYTSADWVSYTVQSALSLGTYYWRVRELYQATIYETITRSYSTTGTFIPPAGVTSAVVKVWGAGGGGGGGASGTAAGGGGGGGGGYSQSTLTVVPGVAENVSPGAAGAAGSATPGAGGIGGDSWFRSTTTLLAKGGTGGGAGNGAGVAGGTGGQSASGVGTITHSGGAGGAAGSGASGAGGGGGGSGGDTTDGGAGGVGTSGNGNAGAAGTTNGGAGSAGNNAASAVGGGGGGAPSSLGAGFSGAAGRVDITYTAPTVTPTYSPWSEIRSFVLNAGGTTLSSQILADSPSRFYKMGEASGTITDYGSDAVNIVNVQGTPVYSVTGGIPSATDTAISYDGVSATHYQNNTTPTGTPDNGSSASSSVFTHMCVAYVDPAAADNTWYWTFGSSTSNTPLFGFLSRNLSGVNGRIGFWYRNAGGGNSELDTPIGDGDYRGAWHLLHVTSDGTTIRLYVNGVEKVNGVASTYTATAATDNNFDKIALSGLNRSTLGQFSQVKLQYAAFFPTALSSTRVTAHYNAYLASGGGITPAQNSNFMVFF